MAMLAEPRRKVRYTINPSGKDWLTPGGGQDASQGGSGGQFGQRMLQNMGWREGQGLGKEGQGVAEPIKVTRKTDQRGIGCSSAFAADTMPQSVDFASLLSELNAAHGGGSDDANSAPKPVISLEAKSRASKARLHYQKFTRGKDVSAYDSQSLACIFGSRARQSNPAAETKDDTESLPRSQSAGCLLAPDEGPDESAKHGLQLVQSQTSLQDYFRTKMAELQQRRLLQQQCPEPSDNVTAVEEEDTWTSESSCSAASTADCDVVAGSPNRKKKRRVQFSLSPSPPPLHCPEVAPTTSHPLPPPTTIELEESPEDFVVIDFDQFPGSAFHRVLGYPLY